MQFPIKVFALLSVFVLLISSCTFVYGQKAEELLKSGHDAFELKDYKLAIEKYQEALEQKVDYIEAYRGLWKSKMELGKKVSALYTIRRVLAIDSTLAEAYLDRSILLTNRSKNFDLVFQQLDSALLLKPDYAEAFFQKGMVYLAMGDAVSACPNWQKAADLNYEKATFFLGLYCDKKKK
jgi:tetratricopeptide (TPR) repeat protein